MALRLPHVSNKALGPLLGVVVLIVVSATIYLRTDTPTMRLAPSTAPRETAPGPSDATRLVDRQATTPSPATTNPIDLSEMVAAILDPRTELATRNWANNLSSSDDEKRSEAIGNLGFLDDPRWVPVVMWMLAHDAAGSVRSAAAAALATQSSSPPAAHALTAALMDADAEVREDALLSLKAIRDFTVENDMRQLLTNNTLDADTTREVRLFLDRYYIHKDPLADPLGE